MQKIEYDLPIFNDKDVADLNEYSQLVANALKVQIDKFGNPLTFKGTVDTMTDLQNIQTKTNGDIYEVKDIEQLYIYNGNEWVIYSDTLKIKIEGFDVIKVETLPTENIQEKTIYLVPNTQAKENNIYDEYIYINNTWEIIGTTAVDLSNYYNKEEVDNKVANIQALPAGGTTGQVLTKQSDTDGDANWEDAIVGDTLPVGTIVNYDGDTVPDGYVEVEDEGEIYSTTEQVIGKWINGKPLYRKTYEFKNITVGTSDLYLIDLSKDVNAEMILIDENASYWTLTTESSMFIPVNYFKSTEDCQQTWVYENVLYTRRGSNSKQNLIVTIKYTKTTDTVGV